MTNIFGKLKEYQPIVHEATPLNENNDDEVQEVKENSTTFASSVIPLSFSTSPKYVASVAGICVGMILFLRAAVPPESMRSASLLGSTKQANTIKICANEMILTKPQPSNHAFVKCYDKDPNGDDVMAEGFTGTDGCVTMTYKSQSWDGWAGGRSPDIYCTVNKLGFVESCPDDKDHHNQDELADFGTVTLYRDRSGDYGHDNGCGPAITQYIGLNLVATFITGFGEQCTNHDKCYWDCKIFLDSPNAAAAQEFCDKEMYEGMKSHCRSDHGYLPGIGEDVCLETADKIYKGLQATGSTLAYDKSDENCPKLPNGQLAPSMRNDYSHADCFYDGFACGYDGSTHDDLGKCNSCCTPKYAIWEGFSWDDYYCKCFPSGVKCGSNLVTNNFNKCSQCCHGSRKDAGWSYSDFYCTS
mmetsp:Transcript_25844/g.39097  ORF Transcript_25844/g.39097 Transcript_25844/m.39097 type:complete len:414 (-) Transcript_25844:133-1374(-)|eukprot:CAMPEP_0178910972 /NCGR_PEP_ID=MMETSP0786-20121207/9410_1 /TAXON_ID=186022 /ORGANISM="Thalassionema frauenfeldii, Strain CCMP 1798" /LENGTH=413 /DNA_ID=CAMNT_0020583315 /DNA_START=345 /DNA_END=1586 /DNA_ORIENTATION=-